MPTAEEYRRFSDLCLGVAKTTDDKIEEAMLLQIAEYWRHLALYKAKRERSQELSQSD